jgi:NitT/TauT family transport system ATP-binding protein
MTSEILLQLEHVTRTFGKADRLFTAVKDINLIIHEGEFVALLGPSGCGKSTLLRMITGLIAPSSGVVSYRGKPVKGINPYATMVFQSFALYPWLMLPVVPVIVTVLAFNFFGDGLRDAADPYH